MIWERFAHEMLASVKHESVTRPGVQKASQAPGFQGLKEASERRKKKITLSLALEYTRRDSKHPTGCSSLLYLKFHGHLI